jgi:PAP2 superfamily
VSIADETERPAGRNLRLPGGRQLRDGRHLYWWIEILAIILFYMVYSAIRNANEGGTADAFANARELISWQKALGINHEEWLQDWALHFRPLIIAMNYVYGSLHFVVTAGVGIFLYRRWTNDFPLWRNTLAVTTGLALIGFILWPLMPPRLLPESYGFVDTLAKYPTFWSFNSGAVSKISNQYAAMPSLHFGWSGWCALVLLTTLPRNWMKVLAVVYPFATTFSIVVTGNHYWLDAAGGAVALALGYGLAIVITNWLTARRRTLQPVPRH